MSAPLPVLRSAGLILGIGLLAACADGPDSPDAAAAWSTTVDALPDGTPRVVNTPPAGGGVPGFRVVEELRIGTVDGGGPASFGQLRGLVVTDEGLVAVLDAQANQVRVFDRDGTHVATHGGPGEGPGEFTLPNGLLLHPDGRLFVADGRSNRMNFLDPRDGWIGSEPNRQLRRGYVYGGAIMNDGRLLKPSLTLGPPERRDLYRVFGPQMELLDSIFITERYPDMDPEDPPTSFFWASPDGSTRGYMGVPYVQNASTHYHPDGTIWTTGLLAERYTLVQESWQGDTLRVVETERAAVPIPEPVRDSAVARIRDALAEYGADIGDQSWDKIPRRYPFVERITSDASGDLWVETGSTDASVWDVYSPDGRHLRTVEIDLPLASWLPPVIRGDTVWAIVTDEFDVHHVVRGRIVEAGSGG